MTVLETDNLTKRYGTGERRVLAVDGLDVQIESGEVFGFLGLNGAGKSTTIDMLLDYVRPTEGTATILGRDVHAESEELRRHIGVLPEGLDLYDRLTGRRHLEFAVDWKDADDDADAILDRIGLSTADAARTVGGYSKGMQQRLALGMVLVGDPDLLLLDEPSSGLDPHGIRRMRNIVREEAADGTTVFFSSHILGEVEAVCDRVGILSEGRLVAVDDVESLRETVGAGSELRLRVATDIPVDVSEIDGVASVARAGRELRVTTDDPRAKAAVVARLVNRGVEVLDVDPDEPSLEDVFTAYTTGQERDGGEDDAPEAREVVA
ncbi:ATP-binding cassette domain-containing protein [Natronoarchaeum mannanilyticum]|uniref:ABC transporter ATP-binding protein n=1 Tax=Natronoarchaeum mannanilyticum TaxID=926360 RepID=UPI00360AB401